MEYFVQECKEQVSVSVSVRVSESESEWECESECVYAGENEMLEIRYNRLPVGEERQAASINGCRNNQGTICRIYSSRL